MGENSNGGQNFYLTIIGILLLIVIILILILSGLIIIEYGIDLGNLIVGVATIFLALFTAYLVLVNKDYLNSHHQYVKLIDIEIKSKKAQIIYDKIISPLQDTIERFGDIFKNNNYCKIETDGEPSSFHVSISDSVRFSEDNFFISDRVTSLLVFHKVLDPDFFDFYIDFFEAYKKID